MIKKILLALVILAAFITSCEKDDKLTGGIKLICTNDNIIGANYYVYTESNYNSATKLAIKIGVVSKTTEIDDINPGNYIVYLHKAYSDEVIAVQVTAGLTRNYEIFFN